MRLTVRVLAALCGLLAGLAAASAQMGKRVALVIGNAKYEHIAGLPNVPNDAKAMAALFERARFDSVTVLHDQRVDGMRRELLSFAERAAEADMAVLFYAGHGIEVDRVNYLIPVDARLKSDLAVEDEAVSLDRVLKLMEPARKLRVVILDACRENPFAKYMKITLPTRSVTRGLGRVEPGAGNTLIAFATEFNAVAEDGSGLNSPFTAALVKHLATPGLDLRIALGNVRDEVMAATGQKQRPYVTSSLGGGVIAIVPAPSLTQPALPPPAPPTQGSSAIEKPMKRGPLYAGLQIGMPPKEVLHVKGNPFDVLEMETEGQFKGIAARVISLKEIEKERSVEDYKMWTYYLDSEKNTDLQVKFDDSMTGLVDIHCVSHIAANQITPSPAGRCPPLAGIVDGNGEEVVLSKLGTPDKVTLGSDGHFNGMAYTKLGVYFYLQRRQVYFLGVGVPK